ncbi:hypothetical protein SVAN01_08338 [Stagonosporopsis vannaccii]|nr:hypothetical protein SVAN01_08338 [Stagonosporopsis vannaccii]
MPSALPCVERHDVWANTDRTQTGLRPCFRRGYLLTDGAFDDDGYEEVWHAERGRANQEAVALPCACSTRTWFAHCLGFRPYAGGTLPALITADSHTRRAYYYKAPTARTLNIALRSEHTPPRCSSQVLLATTLTRLLSDPPGTPACSPDRRSTKRARTLPRPSGALQLAP